MLHRGFRYDLHPTPSQARTLREWAGAVRFIFNIALEQRRDFWRQYRTNAGRNLSWPQQSRELSEIRREVDWVAAVPRSPLEQALRDLEKAFAAFFAGRSRYPTMRARGVHDSLRFQAADLSLKRLNRKWSAIRLPNLGWVKFRDTRQMNGRLLNATVALKGDAWTVALAREIEHDAPVSNLPVVGIDRGIAQTLTLSTGEHLQMPAVAPITARRKRAQRALSRCKKGSARRVVAKARVAVLSARSARIRTDWCHRASTDVARRFGVVAVEALSIGSMTASASGTVEAPGRGVRQKAGLNRAILEQCWGQFAALLDYKLAERGGTLISVPAAYTSQTCAACGVVDARSRESQAVFKCVACDHTDNADVNAAKEILRRSTAWLGVEGAHFVPADPPITALA